MATRINTSEAALNARRPLEGASRGQSHGLARPAAGERLLHAADGAARLAIAERRRTEVLQAGREAAGLQFGINAARAAAAGLQMQQESIARIRDLAGQAADEVPTEDQRYALHETARQFVEHIDETARQTVFNGRKLLNGGAQDIPLGNAAGERLNIPESTAEMLGINDLNLSTPERAALAVRALDTASARLTETRTALRAQEQQFETAIERRQTHDQNAARAESRLRDPDKARQAIGQTRHHLLQRSGIAALLQFNLRGETAARLLAS